jgi:hypothetical protein
MDDIRKRYFAYHEFDIPPYFREQDSDDFSDQLLKYVKENIPKKSWMRGKTIEDSCFISIEQMEYAKTILQNYWAPPQPDPIACNKESIGIGDDVEWDDIIQPFYGYSEDDLEFDEETGDVISEKSPPQLYVYFGYDKNTKYTKGMICTWI